VEAGKCVVQGATVDRSVYLPQYYINLLESIYKNPNESELIPFPDSTSIKAKFSDDQLTVLRLTEDLPDYIEKESPAPYPIIRLELGDGMDDILVLDAMMPSGLLEAALIKVRFYLSIAGNKDFIQQKLTVSFHGKADYPRDILANLIQDPKMIIDEFEEGGDGSYMLWSYLCKLVRNDLSNRASSLSNDRIVLQAIAIIDRLNFYFNSTMKKRKETETAFTTLNEHLQHPPYIYTMDQIIKFKGGDGQPLLSHYSNEDLDAYLSDNTKSDTDKIPALIIIMDKKEQMFIAKAKFPLLCIRLVVEALPIIRGAILKRWSKALRNYQTEPSMSSDREFLNLLNEYLKTLTPLLASVLDYRKLSLLFIEMKSDQEGYAEFVKFFNKDTGKPLALDTLLLLKRRILLADAHNALPFWYSVPFIVKIMSFFHPGKTPSTLQGARGGSANTVVKEKQLTFQMVCKQLEAKMVPQGQSLDSYLSKLCDRWARLLKEKDRKNLIEDVNSLIRDRIRRSSRMIKPSQVTEDYLSGLAADLIQGFPALQHLQENSLELYVKLYVIKLLRVLPR
jgi:hypothetical protein